MRFNTPLRYPGGKGKLTQYFKGIIDINNFNGCHYAEPFAGGAGLAMNLLRDNFVSHVYLNDINRAIYAFWYSVLYETEHLCKLIQHTDITMDEWNNQRYIMLNQDNFDLLTLGFSTFFLNRTNRSGILLGGVIGGKEQKGRWKISERFNRENLVKRIEFISNIKNKITIYNLDAMIFIDDVVSNLPKKSITYIDPPYYEKGQGLYENHYNHNNHEELAKKITQTIETPWIVSYDNIAQIKKMYEKCVSLEYDLNYSAQDVKKGKELMFFKKMLKTPKTNSPATFKYKP
ncbi:TPA: DNA adenine methylase [Yersinia enterocolitica]|nr:DNA adenine methylase [Yersinia enterocolitica]